MEVGNQIIQVLPKNAQVFTHDFELLLLDIQEVNRLNDHTSNLPLPNFLVSTSSSSFMLCTRCSIPSNLSHIYQTSSSKSVSLLVNIPTLIQPSSCAIFVLLKATAHQPTHHTPKSTRHFQILLHFYAYMTNSSNSFLPLLPT